MGKLNPGGKLSTYATVTNSIEFLLENNMFVYLDAVLAHDKDTDFALPTRRQQTLYDRGISTRIVSFLDSAVREGLIISQASDFTARGRLSLGDIIKAYLEHEQEAA